SSINSKRECIMNLVIRSILITVLVSSSVFANEIKDYCNGLVGHNLRVAMERFSTISCK
ncbi:MAG: hypothetical protein ACI8PG_004964, partial [Planctomycetota bacterium]